MARRNPTWFFLGVAAATALWAVWGLDGLEDFAWKHRRALACVIPGDWIEPWLGHELAEVRQIDKKAPRHEDVLVLKDDDPVGKHPTFDADRIDPRLFDGYELNASEAVLRLDCPFMDETDDAKLFELRPSYADAAALARKLDLTILPSANLIDGAAKQFDDGLYAAVDLACYRGECPLFPAIPDFVQAVFDKLPQESPARPFLGAALELAGHPPALTPDETQDKAAWLREFDEHKVKSKPIAFYTWLRELEEVWRVFRFLQWEFGGDGEPVDLPWAIAQVIRDDATLRESYNGVNAFYGRLTNPLVCLRVDMLTGPECDLGALCKKYGVRRASVAVFPPSTSRETELTAALFPQGIPPDVNLMAAFIRAIRDGTVNLRPPRDAGWYQYQVYALETMLLPSLGQEDDKLVLTARYKKRLVEAFKALVSKRRETHIRQLDVVPIGGDDEDLPPPPKTVRVSPRLRIEPCATFYLRTARAYGFVGAILEAAFGADMLAAMHALREDGERPSNLADEIEAHRLRSYGFYLIACEDLGMAPEFRFDEDVDRKKALQAAQAWLDRWPDDPDLQRDTRMAVPVCWDWGRGATRLWATIGIRLARLEARYEIPPKLREPGQSKWNLHLFVDPVPSEYVIPMDEFAEIELQGSNVLTREEFQALCNRNKTRQAILEAVDWRLAPSPAGRQEESSHGRSE